MRSRIAVFCSLCCVTFAFPAFLRAQFQAPAKEELEMTSDPKAPGADAVYLYREVVTDDKMHFLSYYERIKVFSEKGKELATIRIPYAHGIDTVTDIQGRTIHSDGTVIPLSVKPTDLMEFKEKGYQVNTVVFTLPSVEVGSVLEYRLKIRSPDDRVSQPDWDIQQPYFVHKAHYSFHPNAGGGVIDGNGGVLTRLMYSTRVGENNKLDYNNGKDLYSMDLVDIPGIPKEDWMPPTNVLRWRVQFYYTNAATGPEFWNNAGKHWAKHAQEFTNPSKDLSQVVATIVSPADTEEQKTRKIYDAVQKLDNTDFTRTKSAAERKQEKLKNIRNAEDVWKQKSGTDDEIALLFVALGRAAGLKVYPVEVVDRNRAIFDDHLLSASQLDDYLAVVSLGGKDIFVDPGQKMAPFGQLAWKHSLATGFRLTDNGPTPVTTPGNTFKSAAVERIADLYIGADGSLKGSTRYIMSGPDALHWRQLALENDEAEVKKQFNEYVQADLPDGVAADFDHFLGLDDYSSNLMALVKLSGNIGSATGKHFFVPALFFEAHSNHPFVSQEKRISPIDVHYAKTQEDEVTFHLPPGYALETAPQPASAMWANHAGFKIGFETNGDTTTASRTLVYNYTLLPATDYPDLHDFYQKVATADQQQLVLTRAQVAKGN